MHDPLSYRSQFPIFTHHPDLIYLDNAATTHKPAVVIQAIQTFYEKQNANIHRGVYELGAKATQLYESTRAKTADWLGARMAEEIVFTAGTTAAINLVAHSFLEPKLTAGDNVVISAMEHHANMIPWQQACLRKGAELRVIPVQADGRLDLAQASQLLDNRTKLLALVHISNSIGIINPIEELGEMASKHQIPVLVDGAQSIAYYPIDVQDWNCDFFVCSAHKFFGPTGMGFLYARNEHLQTMSPWQTGGGIVREVDFDQTSFAPPPTRFEAGTPNMAGVAGLNAAIDFVQTLDQTTVSAHLQSLRIYALERLQSIKGVQVLGTASPASGIVSFVMDDVHPHDIASFLGGANIAVRAGHHCTQPLLKYFGLAATTRASFSIYNTKDEVDLLVAQLQQIQAFFS